MKIHYKIYLFHTKYHGHALISFTLFDMMNANKRQGAVMSVICYNILNDHYHVSQFKAVNNYPTIKYTLNNFVKGVWV